MTSFREVQANCGCVRPPHIARALVIVAAAWVCFAGVPAADASSGASKAERSPDVSVPSGQLAAISCSGAADCMAVGQYVNSSDVTEALAEVWNGTS